MNVPSLAVVGAFLALSGLASASDYETASIRGEVRDSVTLAIVPGVQVRLADKSVVTDEAGRFVIPKSAPPYRLALSKSGRAPVIRTVSEVESLSTVVLLLEAPVVREELVDVFGVRNDDPAPASIPLRPQQVFAVAGAVDNVFRALHTLPGVAATEEFGSRLAVRGGTPDQNLTVMDGVEIHNPYRLFGLTSAFNPETVEKFELSAGAFSAKYGDRLSSILIVENRDGRKDAVIKGSTTLSITDGNVLVEGPWRNRDKGSWLVSARRTYYDLVAERLTEQDLPGFQDVQFRQTYEASPETKLTLFGIRSREGGNVRIEGDDSEYGAIATAARNDVFGLRARRFFGTRLSSTLALAYYEFAQTLAVDARFEDGSRRSNGRRNETLINIDFNQTTTTRDFSFRNDWSLAASSSSLWEAGLEFHRLRTGATYDIEGERNLGEANGSSVRGGSALPDFYDEKIPSNRWGAYVQNRINAGARVSLEGGLRLSRSSLTRDLVLEPRVSLVARRGETLRFRAALGAHSQSPGIEKLLQADYFLDFSNGGLRNERSRHATIAVEKDFSGVSLRAEAYYKGFNDLIVGALESSAELAARISRYDFPKTLQGDIQRGPLITTTPENSGAGRSRGLEIIATRPRGDGSRVLSGWASYSLGKATKEVYDLTMPFEYDRRHALSLVGQVKASRKVEVGFTLRAASGFPRTKPIGSRVVATEDSFDDDRDGNRTELVPERDALGLPVYTANFGSVSNLLRAHYPVFMRLDLRVNWRPRGEQSRWLFYLELINATNRQNVGQYEAKLRPVSSGERPNVEETPAAGLPRLPTFGIRFHF
jgi:hypothetical protein